MRKKYKALMLDLDGTTIPNDPNGMPSKKVKEAIESARKKVHVGIATSRPFFKLDYLIKELSLSGPSIIHSGTQIMDLMTNKVYISHIIPQKSIQAIYEVAKQRNVPLIIDEEYKADPATEENILKDQIGAFAYGFEDEKEADLFCNEILSIPHVITHKIVSWTKGNIDVSINPSKATKEYAIFEVAKILGIETDEIIGVGDGYNDLPLLMACGLKVAMGNAVDELKAIADYIAPSVEEDGVADVIEKFIL